jgi:hypothetical protein
MHRSLALHALLAVGLASSASLPAAAQPAQGKTHVGSKPGGLVSLFANVTPGQTVPLQVANPDGTPGAEFTLPPGTALVVTDLVANLNAGGVPSGLTRGGLTSGGGAASRPSFAFYPATEGGDRQHLTTGVLWTTTPQVINAADSGDAVFVYVYGYLVKDK